MKSLVLKVPDVVKLQVSQVIKLQQKNTTSNPMTIDIVESDETKFNSSESIENIREATKSHKFSSSVNASGTIFGIKSSSSAGYEFEELVKTYYRASGKVEKFQTKTSETKFSVTLSPGDEITIYTNTLSGGGYEHVWDTTEKLTDATQTIVSITVGYDLTHIFDELMMKVIDLNPGIHVDSGEWSAYSQVCQKGKIGGIETYISEALKVLWTTGLDQSSWADVKAAARSAQKMDGDDALQTILLGFFNIKSPSHNAGQWNDLMDIGRKYLA
ncbi:hypothetical protein SAMN05877838_1668 [Hoeflea halophila]|uniref:Uncharacterized protein n=1 Tax=Hoeflea halophila TaxID=714899 RepID=A0A286IAY5_9HYPH|nr:hypothetical protein [Hoeflea halophila]SOE16786.1 hypothetical protein SAMN05877838_1668 [Hoeflea halophila]